MSEVIAETLDLSRLLAPVLIDINYEGILDQRLVALKARLQAAGIDFDVDQLEFNPGVVIEQADAYREMLTHVAINDAYKAGLIAFARGAALDHLAATLHFISRLQGEDDERFRRRVQLEAENKSGGRIAGYIGEALKVSLDIYDVGGWVDRSVRYEPVVRLAVQVKAGNGVPPMELVQAVQAHIDRPDVRQATDVVVSQPVEPVTFSINGKLFHRPGPDPVLLKANALAALQAMVADRFHPGRDVPLSAIISAASVPGIESAQMNTPSADLVITDGKLAVCTGITLATEVTSG